VYPYVDIEPGRYRRRILNACNTSFVRLRLVYAKGRAFKESTEPDVNALGRLSSRLASREALSPRP